MLPNHQAIRKIVVPIAGLGIRLLPTTKALPKEMLPLGKYPAIQLVVEEMLAVNLKKFLFITSRSKTIVENQFDSNLDIVRHSKQSERLHNSVSCDYSKRDVEFFYSRQKARLTIGAAVAAARTFVDDEHFVFACGDTVINSLRDSNFVGRMIRSHLRCNTTCTVGVRYVPDTLVSQYGSAQPATGEDLEADDFLIEDIVEKPHVEHSPNHRALSARYIFGPEIFDEIGKLEKASDGEIGITDAIRGLINSGYTVRAVQMRQDELFYDIRNHESYFKAFIDFARRDPDCGEIIQRYMASCV